MSFLFATYAGKQRQKTQITLIEEVKQKERGFYETQRLRLDSMERGLLPPETLWYKDPSNPLPMGFFRGAGSYAVSPPANLSILSVGQSDVFPFYIKVALDNTKEERDNIRLENPFKTALGHFDLAFVLTFLLPLAVIALSHNLLSAEREQGTLPLLQTAPLALYRILAFKAGVQYMLLLLLSVGLLLISFLVFGITLGKEMWLVWGACALYLLFWFLLCFAVNLLGKSSPVNAMWLTGAWLFFGLVLPGAAGMLAANQYPVPSRAGFGNALRDAQMKAEKEREKIVENFYTLHPQLERPADENQKTWKDYWREGLAEREYTARLVQKVSLDFAWKAEAQRNFASRFRYLSPCLVFHGFLTQSAGTDSESCLAFERQAQAFEQAWADYFKSKFLKDEKLKSSDFAQFPSFEKLKASLK